MEQQIRFCTTSDNVRIAYAVVGSGPARVWAPGWISHLEVSWETPGSRADIEHWAQDHTIVRYDKRGTGLSQRELGDYSLETRLRDLEAVVDDLKLRRFSLSGVSEGGPVALAYAAKYPRRVSHLVLMGTFARNPFQGREAAVEALANLIEAEWGFGSKTIASVFYPDASPEELKEYARWERKSATGRDAAAMIRAMATVDVSAMLPRITSPTLVIHGTQDISVPFQCGVELAAAIKNARLLSYDGPHFTVAVAPHLYAAINGAIHEFLGDRATPVRATTPGSTATAAPAASPVSLRIVLFTDIVGHTEMMQRLGDAKGRDVLREHERITRDTLKVHSGAEVKTMGDGFMASFGSVTSAIECAIALQRAFAAHSETASEPLAVRVGLNAGEPIEEDGDLFGATVILASRVAAKAGAGQILVPDTVRGLLTGKNYLFSDHGEFLPKGFDDAVRLYEVRWRD